MKKSFRHFISAALMFLLVFTLLPLSSFGLDDLGGEDGEAFDSIGPDGDNRATSPDIATIDSPEGVDRVSSFEGPVTPVSVDISGYNAQTRLAKYLSKVYGTADPATTDKLAALATEDLRAYIASLNIPGVDTTAFSISIADRDPGETVAGGPYAYRVTVINQDPDTYELVGADSRSIELSITKATLYIRAPLLSLEIMYGDDIPDYKYTIDSGVVNPELGIDDREVELQGDIPGLWSYYVKNDRPGIYSIEFVSSTAPLADNYVVKLMPGILNVKAPKITVTLQQNKDTDDVTTSVVTDSEFYDADYLVPDYSDDFTEPAGTHFAGWNTQADGSGDTYYPGDRISKLKLLSGVLTLYAQYEPGVLASYTVRYMLENANDSGYTIGGAETRLGIVGEKIAWTDDDNWKTEIGDNPDGFYYDHAQTNVEIERYSPTVIEVYLNRKTFEIRASFGVDDPANGANVTYAYNNYNVSPGGSIKYGANLTDIFFQNPYLGGANVYTDYVWSSTVGGAFNALTGTAPGFTQYFLPDTMPLGNIRIYEWVLRTGETQWIQYNYYAYKGTGDENSASSYELDVQNAPFALNWTASSADLSFQSVIAGLNASERTVQHPLTQTAFNSLTQNGQGTTTGVASGPAFGQQSTKSNPYIVNIYYRYLPYYKITLILGGGEFTNPLQDRVVSRTVGSPVGTLPLATNAAYDFGGWYTLPNGPDGGGIKYEPTTIMGNKDIYLFAYWDAFTFDIDYGYASEGGGDNPATGNPSGYSVRGLPLRINDPIRENYEFAGWSATSSDNGDIIPDDEASWQRNYKIPTGVSGDIFFKPHWKPIEYKITYNLNGGINDASNPGKYTIESPDIPLAAPTKADYIFGGWIAEGGITVTDLNPDVKIPQGTAGDIVLTAYWKTKVTIIADDATQPYDGTTLTKGTYKYDGLPAGYTLAATVVGSQREFGSSDNTVTDWAIIRDSDGKDVTTYFDVTPVVGKLTITKSEADVVITTATDAKAYDGTALTNAGYTVTGLPAGYTVVVDVVGSQAAVGTSDNVLGSFRIIRDRDGEGVTEYFNVRTILGTLTVTAVPVIPAPAPGPAPGSAPAPAPLAPTAPFVPVADEPADESAPAETIDEPENSEIDESETPQAPAPAGDDEPTIEPIPEPETPLAATSWALIGLLLAIAGVLSAAAILAVVLARRK
jgi:uncharacterized repeat protein (TIGR02543 family)